MECLCSQENDEASSSMKSSIYRWALRKGDSPQQAAAHVTSSPTTSHLCRAGPFRLGNCNAPDDGP